MTAPQLKRRQLPDQVAPGLYQGPKPPPGVYNADVLVLMAEEYQPSSRHFPGVMVIHGPIDDDPIGGVTRADYETIQRAAHLVGRALRDGKTVLVTCNLGLNRSGVVSALGLRLAQPSISAGHAIRLVRSARGPWALSNLHFEKIVRSS